MRVAGWVASLVVPLAVAACGATPPREESASLLLARRAVEEHRGEKHRAKMRVTWPAIDDTTPPDGAEVVVARGYISYGVTRLVFHDDKVEAGSMYAGRSWFYNRKGESFGSHVFDVSPERFTLAWNAMRRLLAASDERIEPEPEDHPHGGSMLEGSHESADWIRVRGRGGEAPVHCADRPARSYGWDDVRKWEGLRDQAIFEVFEALVPQEAASRRPVPIARWIPFAAEEIRGAAKGLDVDLLRRDDELLDTCLRVLGEAGDASCETDVASFASALAGLDASAYPVESALDEVSRSATRLRVRLHWERDEVVQILRSLPDGTWAREDQAKWLREAFRAKDPAGWAEFLIEESMRADASSDELAAAAAGLRDLPSERAVPVLHDLIARPAPYVRLEAALALHDVVPEDAKAGSTVVALALDRTIACDWRPDLVDRWSRNRALVAALDWGGLTPAQLRAHLLAPKSERPEFVAEAQRRLAKTSEALSDVMVEDSWGRVLDLGTPADVCAGVRHLLMLGGSVPTSRMLAALDRIAVAEGVDLKTVDRLRGEIEELHGSKDRGPR